ncbi:MAG: o-succinylbenzoate synthase [Actinomycetia bacterium]|nr:o-succinylbenzoate synthase [Actinomycetes bacterium]
MERSVETPLRIERISLDEVALPLREPLQAAWGAEPVRRFWLVGVHADGLSGWAETVAGDAPLYAEETHAGVADVVRRHLGPRLMAEPLARPEDAAGRLAAVRGNRMAKAGLEMAVWDWFARRRGEPLWRLIGGRGGEVPAGIVLGFAPLDVLVRRAEAAWAAGYRRIKLKIRPGFDREPLEAVRRALPDAVLAADANGSYRRTDTEAIRALDPLHLDFLEQPLPPEDLVGHARLQAQLRTPVALDESVRCREDAETAWSLRAARIFNVKPGRVGGLAEVRRIARWAAPAGASLWCGGMLESGVGRAAALHVASLAAFDRPPDLSASSRYFAVDLVVTPFELTPQGTLRVPDGPGIGVVPDPDRLRRFRTGGFALRPGE